MPDWYGDVAAARDAGFTWYDLLTAHDNAGRTNEIVVTLRLRNLATGETRELTAAVDRDTGTLPDTSDLFAGAAWGQRYVHDFYGVGFDGADLRPLLRHEPGAPLRKDVVLGARAVTPPPAGDDRRAHPAGVPERTIWGDRDPSLPPPTADEIVGAGARRRRR